MLLLAFALPSKVQRPRILHQFYILCIFCEEGMKTKKNAIVYFLRKRVTLDRDLNTYAIKNFEIVYCHVVFG